MKLIVFSDVHGDQSIVDRIIEFNPGSDYLISLGDTELTQEYLVSNDIVMIKGNSRHDPGFVYERILEIDGYKLFLIHGHKYHVGRDLRPLAKLAIDEGYHLVLYGHTHLVDQEKVGGIQFLNPGSCAKPRNSLPPTYLIIDIDSEEIKWTFKDAINNRTIEV